MSDLISAIGAEAAVAATASAAARAVATSRGLIDDRFAAPLVHAAGVEFSARVADGDLDLDELGASGGFTRVAELFAARTRFFDNFLADATNAGVRQVVILAAGLDARAYRLWWPDGTTLYEIDQPQLIAFKAAALRALGAVPNLKHRAVGTGLWRDWPIALQRVGFDDAAPTAWVAQGLFTGALTHDTQDWLLDNITGHSAAGSRLATDCPVPPSRVQAAHTRSQVAGLQRRGLNIDFASLAYPGVYNDVGRYLVERNWTVTKSGIAELFSTAGLPQLSERDLDGAPAAIGYLSAVRG